VANADECKQADLLGIRGVVAPPLLLGIITDALGSFTNMRDILGNDVAETLMPTHEENALLRRIERRLGIGGFPTEIKVARFHLLGTTTSTRDGVVYVAKEMLADPVSAMRAISMELGKTRAKVNGTRAADEQVDLLIKCMLPE